MVAVFTWFERVQCVLVDESGITMQTTRTLVIFVPTRDRLQKEKIPVF